jgi:hypothetical protein
VLASLTLTLALQGRPAHAGDLDGAVESAVAVHVTSQGLSRLGDIVEQLIPESFTIAPGGGSFACDDSGDPLAYALSELELYLGVDEVQLRPADGRLELTLYGTLSSSAATLDVTGDCSILEDLAETCGVQVPVTAMQADLSIAIEEVDGAFDVTVEPLTVDISPIGNPLSDCTLASAVGTLLGQNPLAISDLILDNIEPSLSDLPTTIEGSLEDILGSLAFQTDFALLAGAELGISLYPSLLELSEAGMIIGLGADITGGDSGACVDTSAGPGLSELGWPAFAETASGTSLPYDAGVFIGRDFVDHLLWSAWGSGALCLEMEDLNGVALTTGLMSSFFGAELVERFGEEEPALLSIVPDVAPKAIFSDDQPPVAIGLEQLGVELYTGLDGRTLRALRVDVDGDIGINVGLRERVLETALVLDEGSLSYTETYSELLWPGYSSGLPALVELALGSFLPEDLLPTTSLPYLLGAELSEVAWLPTDRGDWLGGYVIIDDAGVAPLKLGGCSADELGCGADGGGFELDLESALGCKDGGGGFGCEDSGGCSAGGRIFVPTARLFPAFVILLGVLIRRRD